MEISLDILWYIIWQKHVTKKNAGFWNRYSTFCWTIIPWDDLASPLIVQKARLLLLVEAWFGWLTCPLFWSQFIITIWIYIQHMLSVCLIIVCIKSPGIGSKTAAEMAHVGLVFLFSYHHLSIFSMADLSSWKEACIPVDISTMRMVALRPL
jgi:hypothetical protein